MSKTYRDEINNRRNQLIKEHGGLTRAYFDEAQDEGLLMYTKKSSPFPKRTIARRIRHKTKQAIRTLRFEDMFQKWNGAKKIKTGY